MEKLNLLSVSDAQAKHDRDAFDSRGYPKGAERIDLRMLPPPFMKFAGISNDCDSGKFLFSEIEAAFRLLRHQLGLPVGDSYFPDMIATDVIRHQPTTRPDSIRSAYAEVEHADFVERMGNYIRWFHRGWFDTVHGFVTAYCVKLSYTKAELKTFVGGDPRAVYAKKRRTLRVPKGGGKTGEEFEFMVPSGWEVTRPPRYALINFQAPVLGSRLTIRILVGSELRGTFEGDTENGGAPLGAPNWYVIDLWRCVGMFHQDLHRVKVQVEISGGDGAFLDMDELILTSHVRGDLERYARLMSRYNMAATCFTSHGIGLVLAPSQAADVAATDPRRLADCTDNIHYAVDILKGFGIEFLNTFSNTSKAQPVRLDQLAFANSLNDGRPVYDFNRYIYAPKTVSGASDYSKVARNGRALNPSLVDVLGSQIAGFLAEIEGKPYHGGLIYTHLYAANRPQPDDDQEVYTRPYNKETMSALVDLSRRYYNDTRDVPVESRLFMAPLPTLLRMSVSMREIGKHAYILPDRDEIHVESWHDHVLDRVVPSASNRYADLCGLTFYVSDSGRARLFVDGEEVGHVIRNHADETGRESITVADVSAPLVLLGRVPIGEANARVQASSSAVEHDETRAAMQIALQSDRGSVRIWPAAESARDYGALRVVFSKSSAKIAFALTLQFESGLRAVCRETDCTSIEGGHGMRPWRSTAHGEWVVPFYQLVEMASARAKLANGPGLDRIAWWQIDVIGETADRLMLELVHLLRDGNRANDDSGCIVGGHLSRDLGATCVEMRYDGDTYVAAPSSAGHYFFSRKVRPGSIVEIRSIRADQSVMYPANGRRFEILTDKTDVDFLAESEWYVEAV